MSQSLIGDLHNSLWRELLLSQLDESQDDHSRRMALYHAFKQAEKVGPTESELAPDAHDCGLLVRIGLVGEFPSRDSWDDPGSEVLSWLWNLRHASFVPVIEQHYGAASDRRRCMALVLLCCQESVAATELLVRLLDEHGLPARLVPRFFMEMSRRQTAIAPRLFPKLLLQAGEELAGVMNYFNVSMEAGAIAPSALQPAADSVCSEAERLLATAEALQQPDGTKWRTAEDYAPVRSNLGVYLDLLGIIPEIRRQPLERAMRLQDPGLVLFAIVSLIKKGIAPAPEAVELCARSHETRAELHRQLKLLDKLDGFPREFLTFEAFAAAAMTQWLLHPSELGYEPRSLELVAEVAGVREGNRVIMCLWKFTTDEGDTYAGASGPHPVSRPVEPLWGEDTFSNFTEWHTLAPEQHLEEILGTLQDWSVAWRQERM